MTHPAEHISYYVFARPHISFFRFAGVKIDCMSNENRTAVLAMELLCDTVSIVFRHSGSGLDQE